MVAKEDPSKGRRTVLSVSNTADPGADVLSTNWLAKNEDTGPSKLTVSSFAALGHCRVK